MIMDNKKVKELVLAALGIALVFLATYCLLYTSDAADD